MPKKFSKKQISSFQKKVFNVVGKIPKGKTTTYREVAEKIGRPRAWRAVGNILNKNQDFQIPCHRVIRLDGEIGGYRDGPRKKAYLLKKEGVIIRNRRYVASKLPT